MAKDAHGKDLPTGSQLAEELISFFKRPDLSGLQLDRICTILNHDHQEELHKYLKSRFCVKEFDPLYLAIDRINIEGIFTTNIDDLPFQIYAESHSHYLNDLDKTGPVLKDRNAVNIVCLHGSILDDSREFFFSSSDIASAFHADPDRWHMLTGRLQAYPTLFWGSSINDSGTLEALNPKTIKSRPHKYKWVILKDELDTQSIQYFRALGFHIIISSTYEMLEYINNLLIPPSVPKTTLKQKSTKALFPFESIPDLGIIPVRPITEFYMGESPSWSDIYSGQLHHTSHYYSIIDSLNSGKDTLVIGMIGCGKTTLLMQVAQEIPFDGHKLIVESPSLQKVRFISKKLEGDRALIFVDNFGDVPYSFQFLVDTPNVIAVGFDRDYNFENVSDRINYTKCNIIPVTELSQNDIQQILGKLPKNIKSSYVRTKDATEDREFSLFELIEANTTTPSLAQRFQSVLRQLSTQNELLLDLLLVSCYVHSCRTPVSMDLLLAFFRGSVSDFRDIYKLSDRLKPMISEYYGEFSDDKQDYWMPRSTIVSESVRSQASIKALKRVILKFIEQVSPSRIPKYDIFRRRGYDAVLISKAFQNWQEGKKLYETIYEREKNPFTLQQGALYLSHKKKFKEAFKWIERAILETGGRVFSIRNSHAIILFRANINLPPENPTVKSTLSQSMEILSECHDLDMRKTYHAKVFADHAIQYFDVYPNMHSYEYLKTAKRWLEEERQNAPWDRSIKRLLSQVLDILRRGIT